MFFPSISFSQIGPFPCQDANCSSPWTIVEIPWTDFKYPDCPLTVKYAYRDCPDNGTEIKILDIGFNIFASGCTTLTNLMYPNGWMNPPDAAFFARLSQEVFFQLSRENFKQFYLALRTDLKHYYECGNLGGGMMKHYSSFQSTCTSLLGCGYLFVTNGQQTEFWYYRSIDCNPNSCCTIEYWYCWNKLTGVAEGTENRKITGGAPCNFNTLPAATCGDYWGLHPYTHIQTPCVETCGSGGY